MKNLPTRDGGKKESRFPPTISGWNWIPHLCLLRIYFKGTYMPICKNNCNIENHYCSLQCHCFRDYLPQETFNNIFEMSFRVLFRI